MKKEIVYRDHIYVLRGKPKKKECFLTKKTYYSQNAKNFAGVKFYVLFDENMNVTSVQDDHI